jgi:hypothetical protein
MHATGAPSACSSLSHVSKPNPTGVSKSTAAAASPRDASPATKSGVASAANHRTDGDDRVISLGRQETARRERQLPRTGHPNDVDIVRHHAMRTSASSAPSTRRSTM